MIVCDPLSSRILCSHTVAVGRIIWKDTSGYEWVYLPGNISWMLSATILVWIMSSGVGFLYSGLLNRKNALSMLFFSVAIMGVVAFQVRHRIHPHSCFLFQPVNPRTSGGYGASPWRLATTHIL
jgi:hypothetical protein